MKRIARQLQGLSEEELYALSAAIDCELDKLAERRIARGYQRSTYMSDQVRGERRAPRLERYVRKAA